MEWKDALLLALAFVTVGFALLASRSKRAKQIAAPAVSPPPPVVRERWRLVLVMNATKQKAIFDALASGGTLAPSADEMFEATQSLWFGKASSDAASRIDRLLSRADGVSEPSEYDVHLVAFDLEGDAPGFRPSDDLMSRLDAFKTLHKLGLKPKVSVRLGAEAYGSGGFYKR